MQRVSGVAVLLLLASACGGRNSDNGADGGADASQSEVVCGSATPVPWTEDDHCNCLAAPATCGTEPPGAGCPFGLDWPRWEIARRMAQTCTPSRGIFTYAERCADFDAIVVQGLDSAVVRFYDSTGALVGLDHTGLSTLGCLSYHPSFVTPVVNWSLTGCVRVEVPTCAEARGVDGG